MRKVLISFGLMVLFTGAAIAKSPGANSTTCDGLHGKAFGLCNAYCEAMDCDGEETKASPEACLNHYDKFLEMTGNEPPCESVEPAAIDMGCPCASAYSDFVEAMSGEEVSCITEDYGAGDGTIHLEVADPPTFVWARSVANGYADCMTDFGSPEVWIRLRIENLGSNLDEGDMSDLERMRNAFYMACSAEIEKIASDDFGVECNPYEP